MRRASVWLRLYPRAWRERYGDELAALVDDRPVTWRTAMDLSRSALQEWMETPNMRGSHELVRLVTGYVLGLLGIVFVLLAVQAIVAARGGWPDVAGGLVATARGVGRPLAIEWAFAIAVNCVIAWIAIRLGWDRSRPRTTGVAVRFLAMVAALALVLGSAPNVTRIAASSLATVVGLSLTFWLAGMVVDWALLERRRRVHGAA